jgi:hypothetical protein
VSAAIEIPSSSELDLVFLRALVRRLRGVALEVAIARGRLKRGHLSARAHLAEARGHVTQTRDEVEQLGRSVWGEGFVQGPPPPATGDLEDALDVAILRGWTWAIRVAAEDVALARSMLTRSKRQRVTHAMLVDAARHLEPCGSGLEQLQRRAWGDL